MSIDESSDLAKDYLKQWSRRPAFYDNKGRGHPFYVRPHYTIIKDYFAAIIVNFVPVQTQNALTFDAAWMLAKAMDEFIIMNPLREQPFSCDNPQPWPAGEQLMDLLTKVKNPDFSILTCVPWSNRYHWPDLFDT